MRHPIFHHVIDKIESLFDNDREFARAKRDPWEVAEFRQHLAQVARWTAEAGADAIDTGDLGALHRQNHLRRVVLKRFARQLPWWQRFNPMARRMLKRATDLAIVLGVEYLRARFPVVSLVCAASVSRVMRDISQEV